MDGRKLERLSDDVLVVVQAFAICLVRDLVGVLHRSESGAELQNDLESTFSPIPGAPGMLSIESPIRPSRSIILSGGTPNLFVTHASSHHSIGGTATLRLTLCEFCRIAMMFGSLTSWQRSLSFDTITACMFLSATFFASVPMTSSASYLSSLQDRDIERFADPENIRDLVREIARHVLAIRLVRRKRFMAESFFFRFEDRGDVIRLLVLQKFPQHVREDEDSLGYLSFAVPKRLLPRPIGAKNAR